MIEPVASIVKSFPAETLSPTRTSPSAPILASFVAAIIPIFPSGFFSCRLILSPFAFTSPSALTEILLLSASVLISPLVFKLISPLVDVIIAPVGFCSVAKIPFSAEMLTSPFASNAP